MENLLYLLGFILVALFILTSIDDFIWDIVTMVKRLMLRGEKLDLKTLNGEPPKLIALIMAAWHEENVLYDVVENIIISQQYPRSMYHVFLGVYPNDPETIAVAKKLESEFSNVHCIINHKPGPTSKAQNLNFVIASLKQWEKTNHKRFATISIHDSEDLVHPYEFKVTSYLVEEFQALQFPVFPLIEKPRLGNFFSTITTNTYVDEFAENHAVTMAGRHSSGAFVPSAGTGFSLRRDVIDPLGEAVLPENSLTEDYRLSLSLYERGIQMHYVLEKVPRINHENRKTWEYIATRSLFPNTFKTAVKQKTRWILGITMQSFSLKELRNIQIPFIGKYSLYRDQKAKVGNLLSVLGYPIFVYFILSFFLPLNPIYPYQSLSWYLSLFVTVMMLERQSFRAYALWEVYGVRSAFFGTFFPPLLPFRLIWGNVINFTSTLKAYSQYYRKFVRKDEEESQIKKGIEEENMDQLNQMKSEVKQEEALQQAEIINLNPEDSEEKKVSMG